MNRDFQLQIWNRSHHSRCLFTKSSISTFSFFLSLITLMFTFAINTKEAHRLFTIKLIENTKNCLLAKNYHCEINRNLVPFSRIVWDLWWIRWLIIIVCFHYSFLRHVWCFIICNNRIIHMNKTSFIYVKRLKWLVLYHFNAVTPVNMYFFYIFCWRDIKSPTQLSALYLANILHTWK